MNTEMLIERVGDLRSPPQSVSRLLELLPRADVDSDEIVGIIERDSVLTAKLLALCNSAAFGFASEISSVAQAVLQLGSREVGRLVLSLSFGSRLSRPLPGYAIGGRELLVHSVLTGKLAEQIIPSCTVEFEPSVAYTAGLLHDIGKAVLDQVLDDRTQAQIRRLIEAEAVPRLEAERAVLSCDHAELGRVLLGRWRIPEVIVEAVGNHHAPPLAGGPRLSCLIHLANCLAHEIGSAPGWDGYAMRVLEPAAAALGLDADATDRLLILAHETLQKVEELTPSP
jgi:putative nucleotidyltransferase with HDIG domain